MFDFGNANEAQQKAIATTEGPVLITAGPGTGKTFTLIQRVLYLIVEKRVRPEEIMMVTFTEKAAKELLTRLTNELADKHIPVNINAMYIGTFHSVCLRIIKEHLEFTSLKKNYRVLDDFDQVYLIFDNFSKFKKRIPGFEDVVKSEMVWKNNYWDKSKIVAQIVNKLSEEMADPNMLTASSDPKIVTLGKILECYKSLLDEENLLDFSSIQTEAYRLLKENDSVLKWFHDNVRYIMVDEYQDTNFIQEQLIFLLGARHKNICVVGDDDQGLYRFRGATIRNILEFPHKFGPGECQRISLEINYRSNSDIINFYNDWMDLPAVGKADFKWGNFRFPKKIRPFRSDKIGSPTVIKLSAGTGKDAWNQTILDFITELLNSKKIDNLNQIAFLFHTVKKREVKNLASFLESHNINVYTPRSDLFFKREEVTLLIGCLLLLFPTYTDDLLLTKPESYETHLRYYKRCVKSAKQMLEKPENADLKSWIKQKADHHVQMTKPTDYGFAGLVYQLFAFSPFSGFLSTDISKGVNDLRHVRNMSEFVKIIRKFEYIHKIDVLNPKLYNKKRQVDIDTEKLFNYYLSLLYKDGISEYEDDAEYAPSGCVSFLTIHQAKGLEFPIVIVVPLDDSPRDSAHPVPDTLLRDAFEPQSDIKFFDFWRKYYTAFSRAQNLLVISCAETAESPSSSFIPLYSKLPPAESDKFNLGAFNFCSVKDVNLTDTFSFTSHINVYDNCPLQYKFYKELGFTPVRIGSMLFGMLIHQTIEDIHKAVLRGESALINREKIESWFDANYVSLSKSEHAYLGAPQKEAALKQILRYFRLQKDKWNTIREAEVDISLVKDTYILEGKIDLIRGDGDSVQIIDFKSEKKPDRSSEKARVDVYLNQLRLYAHLVNERTGQKVSKMHLYYTGDESGDPFLSIDADSVSIDATVQAFDSTVQKILNKDFSRPCSNPKICNECDFRFFCKK